MTRQLALPLGAGGGQGQDAAQFIVTAANAALVDRLADWRLWPFHVAVLTGPEGSGKTVLGAAFAAGSGGRFIDDADRCANDALFHAWNAAQADGSPLLLAARRPPSA